MYEELSWTFLCHTRTELQKLKELYHSMQSSRKNLDRQRTTEQHYQLAEHAAAMPGKLTNIGKFHKSSPQICTLTSNWQNSLLWYIAPEEATTAVVLVVHSYYYYNVEHKIIAESRIREQQLLRQSQNVLLHACDAWIAKDKRTLCRQWLW